MNRIVEAIIERLHQAWLWLMPVEEE
jgi:hypothetical protein